MGSETGYDCGRMKFLVALLMAAPVVSAATVVVAPQPGGGQVGSLADARDKVRALRRAGDKGPFTVSLRGGVYRLPETFVLTSEDSDVTYEAAPGERPIVSGGQRIEGWRKTAGPVWTAAAA